MLISVLLPQPFGPNTEISLPRGMLEIEVLVDDGVAEPLGQPADGDMRPP